MKDLLQKLTDLENTLDSMDPTPKEVKQINEAASMSINMSGETADDVARLVQIMRDGGAPDAGEMKPDMMPPMGPPDMGKMRDLVKMAPPPGADMGGMDGPPDMPDMGKGDDNDKDAIMGMGGMEDDVEEAGYDNSPEEDYKDHQYMTRDLSGGINREKQAYAAAQDGDNAMAVEELQSALRDALMAKMNDVDEVTESSDEEVEEGEMPAGLKKHMEKKNKGKKSADEEVDEGSYEKAGAKGDGSAKFDEMGCKKEMMKLNASGCAKHEMYSKVAEKYGCSKGQFEKLYASSCGSH